MFFASISGWLSLYTAVALSGAKNKDTRKELRQTNTFRKNSNTAYQQNCFGSNSRAVCWNITFCLKAVPAAIHKWESSYVRG